ncbi:MAG: hypothetical protein LUG12_10155 [Erysipelotrichaceae bacterium]|nr:hypothetical protein [Erysipelotrichaceae bacterium]
MKKRYFVFPLTFLIFIIFNTMICFFDNMKNPYNIMPDSVFYDYFIRGGYYIFIGIAAVYVILKYKEISLQEAMIYSLSILGILLLHIPLYVLALMNDSYIIMNILISNTLLILLFLFAIGAFVYIFKLISKDQSISTYEMVNSTNKIHIQYLLYPLIYLAVNVFVYIYSTHHKIQIQISIFDAVFYNYILMGMHMIFIGTLITYIILRYNKINIKDCIIFILCFLIILLFHIPYYKIYIHYTVEYDLPTIGMILGIAVITIISKFIIRKKVS